MFRSSCLAAALVVLGVVASESALASISLIVVNENTFYEDAVTEVYVSPADASGWGSDRLSRAVLVGDYVEVDLSSFGDRLCWFDVLLVDEDGESFEYLNVNLCADPYIYFRE